ncbi:MAG TPA: MFS transporter [Polyangiales bacterium]|nr:MFS transporter [Polyangiales bacterium]
MPPEARAVQRTYLLLTLLATLAASFIWGINTLFLLDAGLNNVEAFAANAFFTAGEVLFEIPTGVVADVWGRRTSYLLGAATLLLSTLLYWAMWHEHAPLWAFGIASVLLGLGFTFFSGATEAWLVDALAFTGHPGKLDDVLARGQVVTGSAMLSGTLAGAYLAQWTNLGVPYLVRSALLILTLLAAWWWMRDLGFTPQRRSSIVGEVRGVLRASIGGGWRNPTVRWLMLSGLCSGGVGIYAFYALQPYLLQLYGDRSAFGVSGLAAALISGAQIASGLLAPRLRRLFSRRSHVLLWSAAIVVVALWLLGSIASLPVALGIMIVWSLAFWVAMPVRQTLLNGLVPAAQRATVLSFDNMLTSAGGVIAQPALGRVADASGYAAAYLVCGAVQLTALPFLALVRREKAHSDVIEQRG